MKEGDLTLTFSFACIAEGTMVGLKGQLLLVSLELSLVTMQTELVNLFAITH